MYNILIGGAAGQGIDTITGVLERLIKQAGCGVFTTRDLMSRIRGGHNFSLLRFGETTPTSHDEALDGIIALNDESLTFHLPALKDDGFALADSTGAILDGGVEVGIILDVELKNQIQASGGGRVELAFHVFDDVSNSSHGFFLIGCFMEQRYALQRRVVQLVRG